MKHVFLETMPGGMALWEVQHQAVLCSQQTKSPLFYISPFQASKYFNNPHFFFLGYELTCNNFKQNIQLKKKN